MTREQELEALVKAQKDYISFLGKYVDDLAGYLEIHHMGASAEQVCTGIKLRDAITNATSLLKAGKV